MLNNYINFVDKGNRNLALRPEMTPSLARMLIKKGNAIPRPIKWFSISRCFRYERAQKGRLREFFQFNADILGEDEGIADAENIALAAQMLLDLEIKSEDFIIYINNRSLIQAFFKAIDIKEESINKLYHIIDRFDKVEKEHSHKSLVEAGLKEKQISYIYSYLELDSFNKAGEFFTQFNETQKDIASTMNVMNYLDFYNLNRNVIFNPKIVRGLDYYTGIVFEIFAKESSGLLRAICGGGRYDNLLESFDGPAVSACGFGMGDVVLGLLLNEKNLNPTYKADIDYFVIILPGIDIKKVLPTINKLRQFGYKIDFSF